MWLQSSFTANVKSFTFLENSSFWGNGYMGKRHFLQLSALVGRLLVSWYLLAQCIGQICQQGFLCNVTGRQEVCDTKTVKFLLEAYQRGNPHTVPVTHATVSQFLLQTITIKINYLHSSEGMEQTTRPFLPHETPKLTFQLSTAFQRAVWWQMQLLSSVRICLVTDTAASSNLFLGKITKRRNLCVLDVLKNWHLTSHQSERVTPWQNQSNYTQQNWMHVKWLIVIPSMQTEIIYWNARHKLFIN